MKKLLLIAVIAVVSMACASTAFAQGLDFAVGASTITSAKTSTDATTGVSSPGEKGGIYPSFSADFMVHKNIGIEGEVFSRKGDAYYGGAMTQGYKPIFYNFNAIWVPRISERISGEVLGGFGVTNARFGAGVDYSPFSTVANQSSGNHLDADFGGGIRAYFWHGAFIRPEARMYLVQGNTPVFSSGKIMRYGVSLGYSFGR